MPKTSLEADCDPRVLELAQHFLKDYPMSQEGRHQRECELADWIQYFVELFLSNEGLC